MSKSTVIILEKDDWADLQKMFREELGYTMDAGRKASNDGGTTWTHNYTRTELNASEIKMLEASGPALKGGKDITKAKLDKLRKRENKDERSTADVKRLGGRGQHAIDVLAAKGLVNWVDPKAV